MNEWYYKTPENIYYDKEYRHYLIEYQGDIDSECSNLKDIYIDKINDKYAILSIRFNLVRVDMSINYLVKILREMGRKLTTITYIRNIELYTLEESLLTDNFIQISPIEATQVKFLKTNQSLYLTGTGVMVGIIDTGIDYLNKEFIDSNGKTRIEFIWDQTIDGESYKKDDKNIRTIPYGVVYGKEEIQRAIVANDRGDNPYNIVPSKDEVGHGTGMAGIIGASGIDGKIMGVTPDCSFGIVKLNEAIGIKGEYDIKKNVYNITEIFTAIEYLKDYAIQKKTPIVIFLPLGTNSGNHRGSSVLDKYISSVLNNVGIIIVTGAGNEGLSGTHCSGIIEKVNNYQDIELIVSQKETYLNVEVWVNIPNIMYINIISPSGEDTGTINQTINSMNDYTFILEKTTVNVFYYIPEELSGLQLINLHFFNTQAGTWKIRVTLKSGENAQYDMWMQQGELKSKGTIFNPSDPYGTITSPGDSADIITVAAYNQNNNNIVDTSGLAFRNDYIDRIDVAAGGINAITTGLNNSKILMSGTSTAAAVVCGVCVILLQWGIVENNFPSIYCQSLKTFLVRGTIKRKGDIYPNQQWGYGILNAFELFNNLS